MPKGLKLIRQSLTKGFTAEPKILSAGHRKLTTEIFELGVYIFTYHRGLLVDQTARKDIKGALSYINKEVAILEEMGYTITWSEDNHRVIQNQETLKYKISI